MTCPRCNIGIDDHPAGDCLNAWVAEKVMGWIWHEWIDVFHVEDTEWLDEIRYGPVRCAHMVLAPGDFGPQGPPGKFRSAPPRYSTEVSAAFRVMEKMSDYVFQLTHSYKGWWAQFSGERDSTAIALTAPLAISRAALKVVMG